MILLECSIPMVKILQLVNGDLKVDIRICMYVGRDIAIAKWIGSNLARVLRLVGYFLLFISFG